jgi:hypothetical protein
MIGVELVKETYLSQAVMIEARALKKLATIAFYLYRYIRGMGTVLKSDSTGLASFHQRQKHKLEGQLTLW